MATLPPTWWTNWIELRVVDDGAGGVRVLQQRAEIRGLGIKLARVVDHDLDALRHGARAHHVERLRMAGVGDEKAVSGRIDADGVEHGHRLGSGGRFVEQRGVGDVEAGQVRDHRLEIEQAFEPALGDLGLIRRVGVYQPGFRGCCVGSPAA